MPDLDELERLERGATQEPWSVEIEDGNSHGEIGSAYLCIALGVRGHDAALIVALRSAAPALLTTARNHERLMRAVEAVCTAPGVNAEDDALLALTRLWEELSGRPGKADAPELADPIAYALLMNPD